MNELFEYVVTVVSTIVLFPLLYYVALELLTKKQDNKRIWRFRRKDENE